MSAVAIGLGIVSAAPPAAAQDEPADERITVTGSRIARSGFTTPTPVTVVGAAELQNLAPGQVVDSLSQLPQFLGNQAPQNTGFPSSAGSNLNLRGAGINRTLTLLDGRRLVSSNRFNTTDTGMIPETLIRSVETVTGGASASYGSDAVAGVVNFILDTDFTGLEAHGQTGITSRGDGRNYEIGAAFGADLGDKAHLLFSVDAFKQEAISDFEALRERDYFRQVARVTNPGTTGPNWIIRPYASPTDFSNTGIITSTRSPGPGQPAVPTAIHRLQFNSDGTTTPLFFGGVGQLTGGCNCQAESDQSYGVDSDDEILPLSESGSAFTYLDYDLTPNLTVYAQGLYGNSRVDQRREGITLLSTWSPTIFSGNPYLPANVQNLMLQDQDPVAAGVQTLPSFTLGFLGLEDPDSPVGDNRTDQENTTYSGTIGFDADLEGSFLDGWHLGGYAQYGTNEQDQEFVNGIRVDRVPVALDAVLDSNGNIVCRAALINPAAFGNCVPLNVFGGVENITEEAADYIIDDVKHNISTVEQTFVEVLLDGELFDGFGAGPVSMAVGASYREDTFEQGVLDPTDEFVFLAGQNTGSRGLIPEIASSCTVYDPLLGMCGIRAGSVPGGYLGENNSSTVQFTSGRTFSGEFTVEEGFVEFDVPLLANLPLIQQLNTNWAARYANYSGSGGVWAYKAGADWTIIDPVRLRGTFSRDTRAAALYERFDQTRGGANVTDSQVLTNGLPTTYSTASFTLGNPDVDPELADTYTFGAIYQPGGMFEGFQASVDYYNITIQDAIATLTAQNIHDRCYGTGNFVGAADTEFCQFIVRSPTTNRIERVESTFLNLQELVISGIDVEARYSRDMNIFRTGNERMNIRFFGSWLEENSVSTSGTTVVDDRAGQVSNGQSLPEYKLTASLTYDVGPISAFVTERYISDGINDRTLIEGSTRAATGQPQTVDDNDVDSVLYTDIGATYTLEEAEGRPEVAIFTNITNLLDQEPPYAPGVVGRTGTTEFNDALHDVVGRRIVVGVRLRY